jgi:cytochrome c
MLASMSLFRGLTIGLALAALPALAQAGAAPGDAVKGESVFKLKCGICHSVAVDTSPRPAPSLKGVVGRKAASMPAFKYSAALKGSAVTWDQAKLDQFLTAPGKLVPGTFMVISLPNPTERQDVIAYLAKSK